MRLSNPGFAVPSTNIHAIVHHVVQRFPHVLECLLSPYTYASIMMQCHVFVKKCLTRQDRCGGQRIVYRKEQGVWFAVRLIMFWTRNPHVMLAPVATVSVAPKQGCYCDVLWGNVWMCTATAASPGGQRLRRTNVGMWV